MIPSQSSFIPLYFDEDEAELWQALQRIEPEKRSSFIKETLKQGLLRTLPETTLKEDSEHDLEETYDDLLEERLSGNPTYAFVDDCNRACTIMNFVKENHCL